MRIVWRIQKKYFYTVEVCRIIACGERWEKYLNIPKKHHICSTNKQTDRHFVCPWFIHPVSFLLLRLFTVVFIALLIWTEQQRPGKNNHHCFDINIYIFDPAFKKKMVFFLMFLTYTFFLVSLDLTKNQVNSSNFWMFKGSNMTLLKKSFIPLCPPCRLGTLCV